MSELPKHRVSPDDINRMLQDIPDKLNKELQKAWDKFDIECDLIIGAIDYRGQAILYQVDGATATMNPIPFPGLAAIGSGAESAKFWLSYRKHILSMSPKRAAYHAYEAKRMADRSPFVNEHIDICIATQGQYWGLTSHRPEDRTRIDCPVNLGQLEEWFVKYGPQSTEDLDK